MDEKIISVLRNTRTALQILAEPIDAFDRFINYKKGYPPLWIRQKVGGLNDFESSGAEYIAYLKLLCSLKPGDKLLDIGCGCGLVCLQVNENTNLPEYLGPDGRYVGIDINRTLIDWCRRHIKNPNCQFTTKAEELYEYKFDVILCKSLFTHLLPSELGDYIAIIKEVLKSGGSCLTTFFLLNDKETTSKYRFKDWDGECQFSTRRKTRPRLSIGYKESWLDRVLEQGGFNYSTYYGSWRGNKTGLSHQDIIILKR